MFRPDEREWKIIRYIEGNPGCSKASVARFMLHDISRITVLKVLDMLELEHYIVSRKDKPNSQICRLFIEEDNFVVTEIRELLTLSRTLSGLLDLLVRKREEID